MSDWRAKQPRRLWSDRGPKRRSLHCLSSVAGPRALPAELPSPVTPWSRKALAAHSCASGHRDHVFQSGHPSPVPLAYSPKVSLLPPSKAAGNESCHHDSWPSWWTCRRGS
jgi:hypothetical protein